MTLTTFLSDAGALTAVLFPATVIAAKGAKLVTQLTSLMAAHQSLVTKVETLFNMVVALSASTLPAVTVPKPPTEPPVVR